MADNKHDATRKMTTDKEKLKPPEKKSPSMDETPKAPQPWYPEEVFAKFRNG